MVHMPDLFDTHCHFDFLSPPLPALWQQCRDAGLIGLLVPGVSPSQWPKVIDAVHSAQDRLIYAALGLHPCYLEQQKSLEQKSLKQIDTPPSAPALIATLRDAIDQLRTTPAAGSLVAIGECGLDGMIDTPMALQIDFFEAQLLLAQELDLPVVIHARRCHNDMLRCLKRVPVRRGGIIHAFSGSLEIAHDYLRLGYLLGVGGTITYARANKTRNAIAQLPLTALVLETDAPDMPIAGRQGEPNSPLFLAEIAQVLAELQGVTVAQVAQQTTANALRLFGMNDKTTAHE
jgi:TatD DNase family protein